MAADDSTASLVEAIRNAGDGLVLAVTGAGVSQASGIATFRGSEPDAIWTVSDVELATAGYFERDPVGQWRWYLERFRRVDDAEPNAAHAALAALERWQTERGGRFCLITQNIDTLHEQAGSRALIKIHGTADRLRCSGAAGCALAAPAGSIARTEVDLEPFRKKPSQSTLPRCPECGRALRAHVLFFDEYYQEHRDYRFDEALESAESADVVVFAGTSFSVGITDLVARAAMLRRAPTFSIDPSSSPHALPYRLTEISARAEELLPAVLAELTRP